MTTLKTQRLILRPWKETDLAPFAKLNADSRVMEYFPSIKSYEETAEEYNRILQHFTQHGWGFWAVALPKEIDFIGFIGLRFDDFPAPFTPAVEIGWRLAFDYWGRGYATEGAKAVLEYGFETLQLSEIVSFTAVQNVSIRAIEGPVWEKRVIDALSQNEDQWKKILMLLEKIETEESIIGASAHIMAVARKGIRKK